MQMDPESWTVYRRAKPCHMQQFVHEDGARARGRPERTWTEVVNHSQTLSVSFSALTLLVGWQEGHLACKNTEWWGADVVICLVQGADLHVAS